METERTCSLKSATAFEILDNMEQISQSSTIKGDNGSTIFAPFLTTEEDRAY